MKVFYLNRARFEKGDTTTALKYALGLAKQDKGIDTITLLVLQQQQYDSFLSEIGFKPIHYKNHVANIAGYKIQIHTVKTYNPNYQFQGHPQSEILIAVGVPPKDLIRFEDKSDIAHCIIVPWTLDENRSFLSVYEAIDLETGNPYPKPEDVDERIINAIGWLKWTSYPNEGYHHPNDSMRLHQMANALKKFKVPVDYTATVYCGMHNGLIPSAARKTADAFVRAQTRLFAVDRDTNYASLKLMMEQKHEDIG